jgi:hypothetical protein
MLTLDNDRQIERVEPLYFSKHLLTKLGSSFNEIVIRLSQDDSSRT